MAVVSLILSKFQNIFAIFVGSDISILHKKGGQSCRSELETLTPGITPRVGVSYSGFNSHERKRVHRMAIILAITNSKGGVGKTTTCANLGAALSAAGKAVLLVDNDPQGDLTKVMRSDPKSLKYTLANLMNAVLDDTEPELFVNRAVIEGAGIHYIPANSKLAGVSSRLVALQMSSRYRGGETGGTPCELVMARVLELFQSQYDYILIDCGHSMDLLTINALAAAHQAIVPVQAHYLAIPHVTYTLTVQEDYPYSVCEDFITPETELIPAWYIMQTVKRPNHVSVYQHYMDCCEALGIPGVREAVDRMIVLDYLIVNEDRHQNNFGVVRNAETLEYLGAAPIYDSGTSLWFDKPTGMVGSGRVTCKPFKDRHEEQIKLVSSFDWLDLSRLDSIEEEWMELTKGSLFLDEARRIAVARALRWRIETLKEISRCGVYAVPGTGHDVTEDIRYSGQSEQ